MPVNSGFPLIRPGNAPFWVIIPTCAVLVGALVYMGVTRPNPRGLATPACCVLATVLALLGWIAASVRTGRVTVSADGLRLIVPLYRRLVPTTALRLSEARLVDLTSDWRLALDFRTNGIGLPGYNVGWFRLGNGEKALAAVTDEHRVTLIPTTLGFSVMVSVSDSQGLIQHLKSVSTSAKATGT